MHVSFLMGVFILTGYMTTNGIAGSYGNCFLLFKNLIPGAGGRWEGGTKGGDICIPMADFC